ncbi:MAG: hypothetical protein K6F27_09740 [Ruminococcus sp.]|nr:hypothetical protein [Ruminococcus sp.]
MTKLEKIKEIIREYENGCETSITAEDIISGIKNTLESNDELYDATDSINGISVEHQIGDPVYSLFSSNKTLGLEVKEYSYVHAIKVFQDYIEYLDCNGDEIKEEDMFFWNIPDAEKWLKEHMPQKFTLKLHDVVYVLSECPYHDYDAASVDGLAVSDGVVKYDINSWNKRFVITEEDIDKTVFTSRKKAAIALEELRGVLSKEGEKQ